MNSGVWTHVRYAKYEREIRDYIARGWTAHELRLGNYVFKNVALRWTGKGTPP